MIIFGLITCINFIISINFKFVNEFCIIGHSIVSDSKSLHSTFVGMLSMLLSFNLVVSFLIVLCGLGLRILPPWDLACVR